MHLLIYRAVVGNDDLFTIPFLDARVVVAPFHEAKLITAAIDDGFHVSHVFLGMLGRELAAVGFFGIDHINIGVTSLQDIYVRT